MPSGTHAARGIAGASAQRTASSGALQALLLSAAALPGMFALVAPAEASSDDVVKTIAPSVGDAPQNSIADEGDGTQEFGIQYSRYREAERRQFGPMQTATIAATVGATAPGVVRDVVGTPAMKGIRADGEHLYGRFRLGARSRIGFDYVEDVWSGASPLATMPANVLTGASIAKSISSFFLPNGQPAFQAQYQTNLQGAPVRDTYVGTAQVTHAMAYASPETRRQTTLKYGYDWAELALDASAGVSSENDFLARFANAALRRDFNDKRTSVSAGLGYTRGNTHATWETLANNNNMATDAYPGQFNTYLPVGAMGRMILDSRLITGQREDIAMTGGVTQVVNRDDLASVGLGFTHTSGFLSNPWKGMLIFFPDNPATSYLDPSALSFNPNIALWTGSIEFEHRPSVRNQLTWDASYLHYFEREHAAGQLHYGLFLDSWGIAAHTFDMEWRQQLGERWTLTPRLRYYSQKAADFYAPYLFAASPQALPGRNFSSDERLSAFGTLGAAITVDYRLLRGLTAELGWDIERRSGVYKLGGHGDGPYADLHSNVLSLSLRGSLEAGDAGGAGGHAHHHHAQADAPAGVMLAHAMDDPGAWMVGYTLQQDRQGSTYMQGTTAVATSAIGRQMWSGGMTMNMQMVDLMLAQNSWLSWMAMPQIVDGSMGMWMQQASMGMANIEMRPFMEAGGVGDTALGAVVRLWSAGAQEIHTGQLLSAPTGSIKQATTTTALVPYDMQLGSGTWDYLPSITYTGGAGAWSWGLQGSAVRRLQAHNGEGYSLGARNEGTAWGGYGLLSWLDATVRVRVWEQDPVVGQYPGAITVGPAAANAALAPDYVPSNYGGHYRDLGLGLSASLAPIAGPGDRIAFEWLRPVHTNFNGVQLERTDTWFINLRIMF